MNEKKTVLCGANAYEEKYYLNPVFSGLPEHIKNELKIMCVLYTHKVGGVFALEFDEEGNLHFFTESRSDDFSYDEIGRELEIKKLRQEKEELLRSLELYYQVFVQKKRLEDLV